MKTNIRMSGLGGQGLVTAASILGRAALYDGSYSSVSPFFGGEKRLAPTESYVRISSKKLYEKGEVTYPQIIIIFHPEVITRGKCFTMPFYAGFQPNGWVIINSESVLISKKDAEKLTALKARIVYVPATKIAVEIAGTEVATNMALLGGLLGATDVITLDGLEKAITQRYSGEKFVASGTSAVLDEALIRKYGALHEIVEKNIACVRKAYEVTKQNLEVESCITWRD